MYDSACEGCRLRSAFILVPWFGLGLDWEKYKLKQLEKCWRSLKFSSDMTPIFSCQKWLKMMHNSKMISLSFCEVVYLYQARGSQRDVVYIGYIGYISALVYEPKCEGRGLSYWVQLCTCSPNKLWRCISIFNLWSWSKTRKFYPAFGVRATGTVIGLRFCRKRLLKLIGENDFPNVFLSKCHLFYFQSEGRQTLVFKQLNKKN